MTLDAKNGKLECVVEYDYDAQLGDELTLRVGDVITDIETMDGGWWKGNLRGKVGMFPDNFVKPLPTHKDSSFGDTGKKCHVLFSYTPAHDDELALEVGDIIEYMGDVEEGWYKGRLNGRVGVFPSNFVEICNTNCDMKSNHHFQAELIDDAKKKSPESKLAQNGTFSAKPVTGRNGENTGAAPDLTLTNGASVPPSSGGPERSPPGMTTSERMLRNTEPAPGAAPRLPPKPVKDQCVVLFPYNSQNQDELTLVEGQVITILSRVIEDAGWWRGELDGKVGVFPDNFVKVLTPESGEVGGGVGPGPAGSATKTKASTALTRGNKLLSDKKPQIEGDKEPDSDNKKISSSPSSVNNKVSSTSSSEKLFSSPEKKAPSSEKLYPSLSEKKVSSERIFSGSSEKRVLSSEKLFSEKKVSSSEKLHSTSSSIGSSPNHLESSRLIRTSSDRGSSSQVSSKMSSGLSAVRSATHDSIRSTTTSSNVSEKKALFSVNSRAEDKSVAKKPAMPAIGAKSALSSVINNITAATANKATGSRKEEAKAEDEEKIDVVMREDSNPNLADVDREKPLTSLTASRVKAPKRRPPSNVFLKENIPEVEDVEIESVEQHKESDHAGNDRVKPVKSDSFNSGDKSFVPGKLGVPVFPIKDFAKSNKDEKGPDSISKIREDNPIKNIWLEELSRKQANRKSMSALNEKKSDTGKPAIPSKPLDTRKSLSNLIRRPNSFGEKTGLVQNKTEDKTALSKTVSNTVTSDSRNSSKQDSVRKLSAERSRKDSVGKESSLENLRNASPKKSSEERLYYSGKSRDSPRSSNKENKLISQLASSKESKDPPRATSKEPDKKKPELTRKSSDSSKSSDTKPSVHSTNLGKPGSWAFTSPERPSDLQKVELSRSKLDLISTRSDSRMDTPTKASNGGGVKGLDTHEEAGFVVVEAANEALASVWAQEGQQPRPPAREKHQTSGQQQDHMVKSLERRVEELERILSRVETSFKSEMAHLNTQLESERRKRAELETEVSKLSKIVNKKI